MKPLALIHDFESKLQRFLGLSKLSTYIAVKIRNQVDSIIAYHLGETANPKINGEYSLLESLRGSVTTFIDVGSNRGDWSQKILDCGAECGWCFDPSSQCVSFLNSRFIGTNIKIRGLALSDRQSTSPFYEEPNLGETSSLSIRPVDNGASLTHVTVTTLDNEFQDSDLVIDFLKTDCEGWDLKVLQGGANLLQRTKYLQFEYNTYWLNAGSSLRQALDFLKSLDFEVYLINRSGMRLFSYEFYGDFFRYSNFFACKKSDPLFSKLQEVSQGGLVKWGQW